MTDPSTISNAYPIPQQMKAWVLDGPEQLRLTEKPVPEPGPAEVLVRIDAVRSAGPTSKSSPGLPAIVQGGPPFNKNSPRATSIWAPSSNSGWGSTSTQSATASPWRSMRGAAAAKGAGRECTPPASTTATEAKGHRANGFTTDGGFAQYAVNHINTLVHVADEMSDEEATLSLPPVRRCTASTSWAA